MKQFFKWIELWFFGVKPEEEERSKRKGLLMIGGIFLFFATLSIPHDLSYVPRDQLPLYLGGKITFIAMVSIFFAFNYFWKAIKISPFIIMGVCVFYCVHGQYFSPGYFSAWHECMLGIALILPMSPKLLFGFLLSGSILMSFAIHEFANHEIYLRIRQADVIFATFIIATICWCYYRFFLEQIIKRNEMSRRFVDVGKFANMYLHDVKGALSSPIIYSEMLQKHFKNETDTQIKKVIQSLNQDLYQLKQLITEINRLTMDDQSEAEFIHISDVVETVNTLLETKTEEIQIEQTGDLRVYASKNQLIRAFLNIIANAAEVLMERDVENPLITIHCKNNKVIVEDNGRGFETKVLKFLHSNRFISTKKDGSGVGTMMIQDYVKTIGGSVHFYNHETGAGVSIHFNSKVVQSENMYEGNHDLG